jgi:Leucine rich repeat
VPHAWAELEQKLMDGACVPLVLGKYSINLPDRIDGPGIVRRKTERSEGSEKQRLFSPYRRNGMVFESPGNETKQNGCLIPVKLIQLNLRGEIVEKVFNSEPVRNLLGPMTQNIGLVLGQVSDIARFYTEQNLLSIFAKWWTAPSIGQLGKLRYLNISENAFSALRESVCSMSSLIELRVTDNQLPALPDCIAQLSRLRELHLRNNNLTTLPSAIGGLSELRQLDLRGNPIEFLPVEIVELTKSEKLDLRWVNSLRSPEWFRSLEERGCVINR